MRWLAVVTVLVASACTAAQDPGLTTTTGPTPSTTSQTLSACPDGGPDATTPRAGCLDPDGVVLRP